MEAPAVLYNQGMADTPSKGGRPSAETLRQRQIEEILDRHSDGEPLVKICADIGLLPREFHRWKRELPKLREQWELADKDYVHAMFDRAAAIARRLEEEDWSSKEQNGSAQVNALKTALDGYQKICAKLNPGKYADQKDKQSGLTVIFNTPLPMQLGDAEVGAIDGDFTVAVDPKKLEDHRGK